MKRKILIAIVIFIFLLGFCLFMYPTASNLWNVHLNSIAIDEYEDAVDEVSESEREQMINLAREYNTYLNDAEKREELGLIYDELLNIYGNGVMGYVEIPKIGESLVIYHHTEDSELEKGLGHIDTTSLPVGGENTHAAIAGHRGLPSAKLLTDLDKVEIGDVFYLHVLGETLKYKVDDISVVEPEEVSKLGVIAGEDYVTLVTCTPYGINSHRLLVRGTRVYEDDGYDMVETYDKSFDINPVYIVPVAMVILVIAALIITNMRKKSAKKKKENNRENNNEKDKLR